MVSGVLMHSGRGGGLSDMFGGGGSTALGSTAAERNLPQPRLPALPRGAATEGELSTRWGRKPIDALQQC